MDLAQVVVCALFSLNRIRSSPGNIVSHRLIYLHLYAVGGLRPLARHILREFFHMFAYALLELQLPHSQFAKGLLNSGNSIVVVVQGILIFL